MSRDFDDIRKKIDQSNKELFGQDSSGPKDLSQEKILKDIADIKKEVNNIAFKVDTMLEILNNFSIMLIEDEDELDKYDEEDEDDDESWVPEQEEIWNHYEEEDEDEEDD